MTIDLAAILDTAAPIAASVIQTSGTRVTISRQTGDAAATVDPVTLAATVSPATVHADIPAIVQALDAQGQPLGPGRMWEAATYRLLLLPDVVDLLPGDMVTVLGSRDPLLPGWRLVVGEVLADTPGVLRIVRGERAEAGP